MQELVPDIRGSDKLAAGLLIECRGQSAEALQVRHHVVQPCSQQLYGISPVATVCVAQESPDWWAVTSPAINVA